LSAKKAIKRVIFWASLAVLFNIGVFVFLGKQKALEFFGGYIIEQSLSLDNLFLFLVIFTTFKLKAKHQRRVLNYGIIGAVILRLIFVVLGVSIVNSYHWVLYIFGVFLIISGVKMVFGNEEKSFENSLLLKILNKIIPVSKQLDGEKFFTKKNGVLYATPLLAILVLIESSDVIFAIDSIPAVFSVTTDPFIVYTSNLFAILGLRSLYFLIERLQSKFCYVQYGVAAILTFTGVKLSILFFHIEISVITSILVIAGILLFSILLSAFAKTECMGHLKEPIKRFFR
jgi:tellurite resistance protein TerC